MQLQTLDTGSCTYFQSFFIWSIHVILGENFGLAEDNHMSPCASAGPLFYLQHHQIHLHLTDWPRPPEDPRVLEVHSLLPGFSSTDHYGPGSSLYIALPQLQGEKSQLFHNWQELIKSNELTWDLDSWDSFTMNAQISPNVPRKIGPFFLSFWLWFFVLLGIILVLTITSLQIYAQMKEAKRFYRPGSKRTKEFMLARTMMVLVLVFLILNTPRLILGLIEVKKNSY